MFTGKKVSANEAMLMNEDKNIMYADDEINHDDNGPGGESIVFIPRGLCEVVVMSRFR